MFENIRIRVLSVLVGLFLFSKTVGAMNFSLDENKYDIKMQYNQKSGLQEKLQFAEILTLINRLLTDESLLESATRLDSSLLDNMFASSESIFGIGATKPEGESRCLKDLRQVASSLIAKDQWAVTLLDSWGKPGVSLLEGRINFVGSYQQCRHIRAPPLRPQDGRGFGGNYCVIKVMPTNQPVSPFFVVVGGIGVQVGICVPDTCSPTEITELITQALDTLNLTTIVTLGPTDCRTESREFTKATVFAIVALSIIAILMVAGTIVDIVHQLELKVSCRNNLSVSSKHSADRGTYQLLPDDEKTTVGPLNGKVGSENNDAVMKERDLDPDGLDEVVDYEPENKPLMNENPSSNLGVMSKVLIAFSVYTNGSKVLNTSQIPGSLTAINGIRFLSMSWVILGHLFVLSASQTANALTVVNQWFHRRTFDVVSNAFLSVDTFFTMSGLLVSYLTYKEILKKGWRINWALYYFHRLWRLTPPYMLSMLLVLGLQKFMGSGALWASTQPAQKTACENNWWTNVLYINNFYNWPVEECFIHAWYLANDMQFYVITPLLLIPFYFHLYAGLASCLTFLLAQWIIAGALTAVNMWPVAFFSLAKPPTVDWMTHYYIAPYCRIGPYVIGILAGCYLAHTNGKTRIPKYVVVIGWTVAIATGLMLVYGIHGDITGNSPSSVGVSMLYNAVARSAWGVCVCWVIVACRCGYGGPVNALLSWPPFVLLGRLTYMAYLIHPCVIEVYVGNLESLFFIDETNIAITYMGIMLFTYMAAFVLMLGLESPMIGLEKILLDKEKV